MVQVKHQVKVLAARPITVGIVSGEHIQVDAAQRHAALAQQLAHAAKAAGQGMTLHGFIVSDHHCTVLEHRDFLRANSISATRACMALASSPSTWRSRIWVNSLHQHRRHIDALPSNRAR